MTKSLEKEKSHQTGMETHLGQATPPLTLMGSPWVVEAAARWIR